MGKQKQQIISRFFAPKPQTPSSSSSQSLPQPPSLPNPSTPPPKISATVTFSPSKRFRTSQLISPNKKPTKTPKFSSVAGDSEPSLPNTAVSEPPPGKPTKTCKFSPHTHNPIPPPPNPSLHQRFIQKLLEPSEDLLEPCSSTFKVSSSNPKYTPLEQQVVELKAKYPDVLLMVEVGYKYRFFGKDAENAARALGIYAHMDHNFLTASIPTVRLNVHVRRLVNAGYKVGVVKQTETAAIKAHGSNRLGPFCRGLSALYTKATLEAAEDLGGGEEGFVACNNYLVCVVENDESRIEGELDVRIGVVGVEVSTGDVVYGEFNDNFMRAGLEAMVLSLSPAELLLGEPLSKQTEKFLLAYAGPTSNVRVGRTSCHCFRDGGALVEVVSLYDNMNEDNSTDHGEEDAKAKDQRNNRVAIEGIMAMPDLAVQALALTIRHLKEFGFERILCLGASFRPFLSNVEMALSANAIQQLEVLKNNSDGSESGSLLQCMNHTLTIFGSRLLRHWVTHPLCDRNMISARLDAVSEIVMSMNTCNGSRNFDSDGEQSGVTIVQPEVYHLISSVLTTLGRSPDIQRGITRIFHRTATPSEFIAVIQVIVAAGKQLQQLHIEEDEMHTRTVNSVLLRKLISTASSSSLISAAAKLMSTLNKEAADQRELHNLFVTSDGRFPEVAEARSRVKSAKDKLALLIELFRKQLGMRKLDYVCVSGVTHLIELPVDMRVPPSWVRVNSTKKMIRYHPPEVLTALDQLSLANEELTVVCRAAWNSFLKSFGAYYAEFQTAVQALATLDCLYSLAILSRNKNYVRPIFVNDNEPVQIEICSGRHPVMETILQDNFVPNDTCLHADSEYCQIITGPNMGGKSCYIRQVALIAIMAQVGSFVPASSAKLHVLDGIYTRMGASDNIHQGRSTFLEELTETSQILQNCTENSLVIIDELGRGTSTHDGVAIAYSTLHYLLQQKKCVVLFVTHYPKLIDIKGEFSDSVGTYHVSYLTSETNMDLDLDSGRVVKSVHCEDVTYLYKLVPGVSERSFGFKVAQLAQLPSSCVRRAIVMSRRFEMAVADKKKNVLELICSKEPPFLNQEEHEEELESLKELTNAYRNFFSALDNAFSGDNGVEKTFQFLHQARGVAMEVLNG